MPTAPSIWLKRLALIALVSVWTQSVASAQTRGGAEGSLDAALLPGRTVWITYSSGREERTRIVGVSADIVTITADGGIRRIRTADVVRIRVRHSDPVFNGALIGTGAAVGSGLFLCSLTESWENCRDDAGPILRIGAIGGAIGIGVDALIRGRRTIYRATGGSTRLRAVPVLAPHGAGLQVSLTF